MADTHCNDKVVKIRPQRGNWQSCGNAEVSSASERLGMQAGHCACCLPGHYSFQLCSSMPFSPCFCISSLPHHMLEYTGWEPRLPVLTQGRTILTPLGRYPGSAPLSSRSSKPLQGSLLDGGGQILSLILYLLVAIVIGKYHLGRGKDGRE